MRFRFVSVVSLGLALMVFSAAQIAAQENPVSGQPQQGVSDGTIMNYVQDHPALTSIRKMNSRLIDFAQHEHRMRDFAKHYGVEVVKFEVLPLKKSAAKNSKSKDKPFFRNVSLRAVTRGDFQNVVIHFNRMALFNTMQMPMSFHMVPVAPASGDAVAPAGHVELTVVTDYFQVANPAEFYGYGNSAGATTAQIKLAEVERQEDEKTERMLRETVAMSKTQENGLLSLILENTLDSLPRASRADALLVDKISWQRGSAFEISVRRGSQNVIATVVKNLQDTGIFQDVTAVTGKNDQQLIKMLPDRAKMDAKRDPAQEGSVTLARPYSPLGRPNPFLDYTAWLDEFERLSRAPGETSDTALKRLTVGDLALTQARAGLLGWGRKAEVALPDKRKVSVDLGKIVSRYDGRVVEIRNDEIVVEERFLDAAEKLITKRSALKVSTSVDG